MTEYRARIGEIIIGGEKDVLVAIALGSCVGISIYDVKKKNAVMAHVALPEVIFNNTKKNLRHIDAPGRYADTAVIECLRLLKRKGAKMQNLQAKIAGGSRMFGTIGLLGHGLNIGDRNIEASIEYLKFYGIPLKSKDVGGNNSRTIRFTIKNSILNIKKGVDRYNI